MASEIDLLEEITSKNKQARDLVDHDFDAAVEKCSACAQAVRELMDNGSEAKVVQTLKAIINSESQEICEPTVIGTDPCLSLHSYASATYQKLSMEEDYL